MLNQKFLKTTAVIFLLSIAIVFLGLYAYNLSQQEKLDTPVKVYRLPTESQMKIVEQNRKNAKQRQQHRSNLQKLASENPMRSDDIDTKSPEDFTKSTKDLSKSQVSIKENLDDLIIKELIKNGTLKIVDHNRHDWGDRPITFDHLWQNRDKSTFETNSIEEVQNYISNLGNSDNPKHRASAQKLRNLLSQMNPPENAIISISVED